MPNNILDWLPRIYLLYSGTSNLEYISRIMLAECAFQKTPTPLYLLYQKNTNIIIKTLHMCFQLRSLGRK